MINKKVIIVTGGSRGIGLETSKLILEKGHYVLATGRTKTCKALEELSFSFKEKFRYFPIDHLQENSSRLIYEECIQKFGRVDGAFSSHVL
jgi:NAD(P)-dependent dehydrogenase (short-subunit alcohol dehydrogenase family)